MFGIHTALVTPFDDEGAVDRDAAARLLARQLDAGVHGVVVAGTTGESPTLDMTEWEHLVSDAVDQVDARVPVSAGIGTNDTRTSVRKAEKAAALGADAGLLVLPYYNKPNPEGLRRHVAAVAAVGLPLIIYHVPGRTGQRLEAPVLAELSAGAVAIKEATGDVRYGGDVLARTTTPLLSGDDFTFLGLMAQGATGVISVLSNVAPKQTVAIYDAHKAGAVEEAAVRFRRLWALMTALFSDTNPVPAKAALSWLGLCRPAVRLPLAPWAGPDPATWVDASLRDG